MCDVFRPAAQPARRIYDAFQDEASHRKTRSFAVWHAAEVKRVWREARDYAQENGLAVPTLEQVKKAESSACGHSDYGAKWAYYVSELLK